MFNDLKILKAPYVHPKKKILQSNKSELKVSEESLNNVTYESNSATSSQTIDNMIE